MTAPAQTPYDLQKIAANEGLAEITATAPAIPSLRTTLSSSRASLPAVQPSPAESNLRAALKKGGNVKLEADAAILLTQTLDIDNDVVLDATGHSVTISGQNALRVFNVSSNAHFKLIHVTVANGLSDNGGGLFNDNGTVEIEDCVFSGNMAVGAAGTNGPSLPYGSTGNVSGGTGNSSRGGAIFSSGTTVIKDTIFRNNQVQGGLGGTGGKITGKRNVSNSRSGNGGDGGSGLGGAIYLVECNADLSRCQFIENLAVGGDGGSSGTNTIASVIQSEGSSGGNGGDGLGAGIFNNASRIKLELCIAKNNRASGGLGGAAKGVSYDDVSWPVVAPGGNGGNGGNGCGGFLLNSGNGSMFGCSIVTNLAIGGIGGGGGTGLGAGMMSLEPLGQVGGAGGQGGGSMGGGIRNEGFLAIEQCLLQHNSALGGTGGTGGIGAQGTTGIGSTRSPGLGGLGGTGGSGCGGGIAGFGSEAIVNSTLYANNAMGGAGGQGGRTGNDDRLPYPGPTGGSGGSGLGGGVYLNTGHAELTNNTHAANSAAAGIGGAGGLGGHGLMQGKDGISGPAGKTGIGAGGGLCVDTNNATMKLVNCIAADSPFGGDGSGQIIDGGHNLVSDGSIKLTASGSRNYTDPRLASLADNGGPTLTLAFLPGSPAIDAGDESVCLPTDQRGVARPIGPRCDIGAFEGESSALPVMDAAFMPNVIPQGSNSTLRITLANYKRETNVIATIRLPSGLAVEDGFVLASMGGATIQASTNENGQTVIQAHFATASTNLLDLRISSKLPGAHAVFASLRSPSIGAREFVRTAGIKVTDKVFIRTDLAAMADTNVSVLYGTINPGGLEASVYFEYGSTTNYGSRTVAQNVNGCFNDVLVSDRIEHPASGYHYRIVAVIRGLILYGTDQQVSSVQSVAVADETSLRQAMEHGGTIKLACDGVIKVTQTLNIAKDTVLDAAGRAVALDGNEQVRVLKVNPNVKLTLINLTVTGGRSEQGGALHNDQGIVNMIDCSFTNNMALGTNSLVFTPTNVSESLTTGGDACGGAVYNTGSLYVTNGLFRGNRAIGGLGGGGGITDDDFVVFPGGNGGGGYGGGIYNDGGRATILHSRNAENQAQGGSGHDGANGGGIMRTCQPGGNGGEARGGWIYSKLGSLSISQCQAVSNMATGGLGGNAGLGGGAFNYAGSNGGPGGAGLGGAIAFSGMVSVLATEWVDNHAKGGNGGKLSFGWRAPDGVDGAGASARGGAIYCEGHFSAVNNTISGNSALGGAGDAAHPSSGSGGGLHNQQGDVAFVSCTMSVNQAAGAQNGGNLANDLGIAVLRNTILNNTPPALNATGPIIDGGHNLSSDATCGFPAFGSGNSQDPKLGALAANGGFTRTLALLPGSPAIDAADAESSPATDQRGMPRPYGSSSDIGAFELSEGSTSILALGAPQFLQDGTLRFSLTGPVGFHYTIAFSEDLKSWFPLTNYTSTEALQYISDPAISNRLHLYYRGTTP